ncbi:MAG: glycosyltransferase family 4 protein, partial [Anaerolineae bacterium]
MRIAIITGEYPPLEGGVGDFTYQLAHALVNQGHRLHILTSLDPENKREHEECLTIYREIPEWGWAAHTQIMRWLREIEPDVINIQYQAAAYEMRAGITLFPRWQGRNLRSPIVTTFHDLKTPYLFPKAGPLRQWAIWQMGQYCNGVIVTNGEDYASLTQNLEESERPPIRLIHIGSNISPNPPEGYERHEWRGNHNILKDDFLLGFFGFLNRSKGVENLLKAMDRLGKHEIPVKLVFVGGRTGSSDITNAAYAQEIDELIAELNLEDRIHYTGFTSPAGVSA